MLGGIFLYVASTAASRKASITLSSDGPVCKRLNALIPMVLHGAVAQTLVVEDTRADPEGSEVGELVRRFDLPDLQS
jgi:hypothetical protein